MNHEMTTIVLNSYATDAVPKKAKKGCPAKWVTLSSAKSTASTIDPGGIECLMCWTTSKWSEWYFISILSVLQFSGFEDITDIIGISPDVVKEARKRGVAVILDMPIDVVKSFVSP